MVTRKARSGDTDFSGNIESNNVKLNNFSATSAPTVNDDSDDGYSTGSVIYDTVGGSFYDCKDASVGSAVWAERGAGAGGVDIQTVWAFNA